MPNLFTSILVFCLIGVGSAMAGAGQSSSLLTTRLYAPAPERPYTPLPERNATKLAAGEEYPNRSGSYCSDESPVCCLVSGEYGCYAKREDCKEK